MLLSFLARSEAQRAPTLQYAYQGKPALGGHRPPPSTRVSLSPLTNQAQAGQETAGGAPTSLFTSVSTFCPRGVSPVAPSPLKANSARKKCQLVTARHCLSHAYCPRRRKTTPVHKQRVSTPPRRWHFKGAKADVISRGENLGMRAMRAMPLPPRALLL